jgi:hypothetical protein
MVWLLGIFAVSSDLHGTLHHEAGSASHACAVTLFRDGVEDLLPAIILTPAPVLYPIGEAVVVVAVIAAEPDTRLPPGCGPPLC